VRKRLCSARGGHRWKTTADAAGSITSCARCRALRHGRTESVKDGSFKVHVNVAADFPRLRSQGPEELEVDDDDQRRAALGRGRRTRTLEQIEKMDVFGLGSQKAWVGLRSQYAASIEVEVDCVLGGRGGNVERVRACLACEGQRSLE